MITFTLLLDTSIAAEKSKSKKQQAQITKQEEATIETDSVYVIIELAEQATKYLRAKRPIGKTDLNPFDLSITKLPKNYIGHDLRSIYEALLKRNKNTEKDTYETTAQHKQRIQDEDRKPLIGTLTVNDIFSFVVIPTFKHFNADNQTLSLKVKAYNTVDWEDYSTEVGIYGPELYDNKSTYIGSNAYGVPMKIVKLRKEWVGLAFTNELSAFPLYKDNGGWFEFVLANITPETAKTIRDNLNIAFIFKLEPVEVISKLEERSFSYLSMESLYKKPTIDSPLDELVLFHNVHATSKEIWVFNKTNGEILLKVKTVD